MPEHPRTSPHARKQKVDLRERIARALERYDLSSDDAWSELDQLSTHTLLEGLEVDPEGVVVDQNGHFKGVMNVYVTLQYDKDEHDGFKTSDSFLGSFEGHMEGDAPKVDSVKVDTSPFYE
jgi:hypothetical protein